MLKFRSDNKVINDYLELLEHAISLNPHDLMRDIIYLFITMSLSEGVRISEVLEVIEGQLPDTVHAEMIKIETSRDMLEFLQQGDLLTLEVGEQPAQDFGLLTSQIHSRFVGLPEGSVITCKFEIPTPNIVH